MNYPGTNPVGGSNHEFEVILDEAIEPESASPAKPAMEVLVIIPGVSDSRWTSTAFPERPA
jgi:hypothetical protein